MENDEKSEFDDKHVVTGWMKVQKILNIPLEQSGLIKGSREWVLDILIRLEQYTPYLLNYRLWQQRLILALFMYHESYLPLQNIYCEVSLLNGGLLTDNYLDREHGLLVIYQRSHKSDDEGPKAYILNYKVIVLIDEMQSRWPGRQYLLTSPERYDQPMNRRTFYNMMDEIPTYHKTPSQINFEMLKSFI
jgi:hypothetical protein